MSRAHLNGNGQLKRRPRRVDFLGRVDDFQCAWLAAVGYSTSFIIGRTGLSKSQITYRIREAGLTRDNGASRQDFRDGRSPFCAHVLAVIKPIAERQTERFIRQHAE